MGSLAQKEQGLNMTGPGKTARRPTGRRVGARAGVVLAAVLAASVPAHAQRNELLSRFDVFVEGGGSFRVPRASTLQIGFTAPPPIGNVVANETVELRNSGRLFAGVDFWITPHDAVQVSYSYSPNDMVASTQPISPPIGGGTLEYTFRNHFLSFDYLHSFPVAKRWRLLLAAGIGRVWWYDVYGGPNPSYLAVNVGAGVSFRISSRWSVRAEYRDYVMHLISSPEERGLVHDNAPTVGVVFRL